MSATASVRFDDLQRGILEWWKTQAVGARFTTTEVRDALRPMYRHLMGRHPRQVGQRLVQLADAGLIERHDDPSRPGYSLWGRKP